MKRHLPFWLLLASPFIATATLEPHALFSDHAVLQADLPLPVWGTAEPGESVRVAIAGASAEGVASQEGKWQVELPPMAAGGPYPLVIEGAQTRLVFEDVLIGEVWLCSGQSNMGVKVRGRDAPVVNRDAEAARAGRPQLRYFDVHRAISLNPLETVEGQWVVSAPDAVFDFSAVAYFFGRDLQAALGKPVGLIHASWGGTGSELWTSAEGLDPFSQYADDLAEVRAATADPESVRAGYAKDFARWYARNDPGSAGETWGRENLDTTDWGTMRLPVAWEDAGLPGFNGVVWFRRDFDLPAAWAGEDMRLRLGSIDYFNDVWINGEWIGETTRGDIPSDYTVPGTVLRREGNVIAVRVLDGAYKGGLLDTIAPFNLSTARGGAVTVSLKGEWRYRAGPPLREDDPIPTKRWDDPRRASSIYNGMIAPLQPVAIRGVIWYQGESNRWDPAGYGRQFPALIEDWRRQWGGRAFPFLFVQVAPHVDLPPELREAQLLALDRVPATAMVVTTDVGDALDVHPLNKEPVGERLALAARALAYGETIEFSGPLYSHFETRGRAAVVHFDHCGGGLAVPGGVLTGFTLAGSDGAFHPAEAHLEGDTVVVVAGGVEHPTAVRYGWANVPEGNLFNTAGLPASPFRSDLPGAAAQP